MGIDNKYKEAPLGVLIELAKESLINNDVNNFYAILNYSSMALIDYDRLIAEYEGAVDKEEKEWYKRNPGVAFDRTAINKNIERMYISRMCHERFYPNYAEAFSTKELFEIAYNNKHYFICLTIINLHMDTLVDFNYIKELTLLKKLLNDVDIKNSKLILISGGELSFEEFFREVSTNYYKFYKRIKFSKKYMQNIKSMFFP